MRKLTLLFVVLIVTLTISPSMLAQCNWSGVTETCGNVGVGTSSPLTIFEVKAATNKHLAIRPSSDFSGLSTGIALHAFNDGASAAIPMSIESYVLTLNAATNGYVGVATTAPGLLLDVHAPTYGFPATSGATQIGIFRLSQGGGTGVLDFGIGGTTQLGAWLQATASNSLGLHYDILLNPEGGNVGVGVTLAKNILDVGYGSTNVIPGISASASNGFAAGATLNNSNTAGGSGILLNVGDTNKGYVVANNAKLLTLTTMNAANTGWNVGLNIDTNGSVGINTTSPTVALDVNGAIHASGNITASGAIYANYQDLAEWVPTSQTLTPGTVVILNPAKANEVIPSAAAYDTTVAGVVSEHPGIVLGKGGPDKVQIATTGRVKVKVDARRAAIKIGDLLVTSDIAGTAMKSMPVDIGGVSIHRPGTMIGKALESLDSGTGEVLVLLSLQ